MTNIISHSQKLEPAVDSFLKKVVDKKLANIAFDGKTNKDGSERRVITYFPSGHKEIYDDPEEQVRAEFWAELIERYHYSPQRIKLEVVVPDRTNVDKADIIVFTDDACKAPYIVVECKREKITPPEFTQAIDQAFGNGNAQKFRANFVIVVAGATRRAFDCSDQYAALERDKNIVADIPIAYGKVPEYKYVHKGSLEIQAVSKETLIAAIKKCHDTLWGGGKLSPPAAFGELCKLIFAKTCDEKDTRKNQPYEFQVRTHEEPSQLSERIRKLYDKHRKREHDAGVFDETIKVPDAMLSAVVSHLESIDLAKTDLDTKGVAFERFMDGFFKGNFGQYFTPREIIQFAVEMFPPDSHHRVLDPACGSGGFLLHALDYIRREADTEFPDWESDSDEKIKHYKYWHDFAQFNLFGIEINDEIARVAKMNMILHDDGHTNVIGEDALEQFERFDVIKAGAFKPNSFDLILTNPPFGAQVAFDQKPHLPSLFPELAFVEYSKDKKKTRKNQKTEILYLERIHQFLREGGRAAIVLPDGILTNSSLAYVRDYLLSAFSLRAVISLPQMAFAHYGAGVKSSLVFVEKRTAKETPRDDEPIFMAAPENIGYDATGRKTWKLLSREEHDASSWTETLRCDLFDAQITYEIKGFEVFERARQVIPNTGLLGEWQRFQSDPEPFFV